MGSKPADKGTMDKASASSLALDDKLKQQASQQNDWNSAARGSLFGSPDGKGGFTGGTVSKFLDPSSLNVSGPTGVYGTQYQRTSDTIAQGGQQARGALSRTLASRGFGSAPSGFGADQMRKSYLDQADTRGQAFSDYAGKSYQDALENFWRANGSLMGEGDTALSASMSQNNAVLGNYANLYGTAAQPRPGIGASLIGAAGTLGGAAMTAWCPAEGALILCPNGKWRPVQELKNGDVVIGIDDAPDELISDPAPALQSVVEVDAGNHTTRVSNSHAFARNEGGYQFAEQALGDWLLMDDGEEEVSGVRPLAEKVMCYHLKLKRSHGYCVDGFWSLE